MTAIRIRHVSAPNADRVVPTWKDGTVMRYVTSTDHKRIGLLYLWAAGLFLIVLGISSLLLAIHAVGGRDGVLSTFAFEQLRVLQSTSALFLVGLPLALGLSTYLLPLLVGARALAWPRLAALGFWLWLGAAFLALASFGAGNATLESDAVPLSDEGRQLWALALVIVAGAAVAASAPLLRTLIVGRAPGLTGARLPVFAFATGVFAIAVALSLPLAAIPAIVFLFDAGSASSAFPFDGLLYGNPIWFLGHPLTYALLIPAVAGICELVPVLSQRPLLGRGLVKGAIGALGGLAVLIGLYHLISDAFGSSFARSVPLAGWLAVIPLAACAAAWAATLLGSLTRRPPPAALALAAGAAEVLAVGVVLGLALGFPGDYRKPASFQLTALFSGTFASVAVLGLLAALLYWFPKLTGRAFDEREALPVAGLAVLGANALLVGQHVLGQAGADRASAVSADWGSAADAGGALALAGFLLLFLGVAAFVAGAVKSVRVGRRTGNDPWLADTLEWLAKSPPAEQNFGTLPPIESDRPLADLRRRLEARR